MRLFILVCSLIVTGCVASNLGDSDNERDSEIAKMLIGKWAWNTTYDGCWSVGEIGFKRNGKLTKTEEGCSMADDGFNIYSYGWYISNGYICFMHSTKKHFNESKPFKFVENQCTLKVLSYKRREITVEYIWKESSHVYQLRRE